MGRDRFVSCLSALSLLVLGACADASEGDVATHGDDSPAAAQPEETFPLQFDIIDDIRGAFNGDGGTATADSGTGSVTAKGIPLHGDPPQRLRSQRGPYRVNSYEVGTGRVYYPTNAPVPFTGMSLCGGFLNQGFEMTDWGDFYASWGIVTVITWTGFFDLPPTRGAALAASIAELKRENQNSRSPLYQKMSDRYGTSGYSMGGGGSTVASQGDASLKSSIGMAPWAPTGFLVRVPSLFMCGDIDLIADCSESEWAYNELSESVPKMMVMIGGGLSHLGWFGPSAGWGVGGAYGLAFAKVFLEGDLRWKSTLLGLNEGVVTTNIR